MTMKDFYEKQVAWFKHEIEWYAEQIAWETSMLEKYRKDDRDMVEYVWSKGPVEEIDIRIYGRNGKNYKGKDTKRSLATRKRYYLRRKHYTRELAKYEALLAKEA